MNFFTGVRPNLSRTVPYPNKTENGTYGMVPDRTVPYRIVFRFICRTVFYRDHDRFLVLRLEA